MKKIELERAWPKYWETHNINEDELGRIATRSLNSAEAEEIWANENWWADAEIVRDEEDQAAWPRGFIRYTKGDLTREEFQRILQSAQEISYVNPEHIAEIILEEENWWRDEFAETGMNEAQQMILDNLGYHQDRLELEDILDKMGNQAIAIESSDEINWPGTTEETRYLFKDGSSVITYLENGYLAWSYGKNIDPPRPAKKVKAKKTMKDESMNNSGKQLSRVQTLSNKLTMAGIDNRIWEGHSRMRVYLTPPREWLEINGESRVGWRGIRAFLDYSSEEMAEAREPYDGSMDLTTGTSLQILVKTGCPETDRQLPGIIREKLEQMMVEQRIVTPTAGEEAEGLYGWNNENSLKENMLKLEQAGFLRLTGRNSYNFLTRVYGSGFNDNRLNNFMTEAKIKDRPAIYTLGGVHALVTNFYNEARVAYFSSRGKEIKTLAEHFVHHHRISYGNDDLRGIVKKEKFVFCSTGKRGGSRYEFPDGSALVAENKDYPNYWDYGFTRKDIDSGAAEKAWLGYFGDASMMVDMETATPVEIYSDLGPGLGEPEVSQDERWEKLKELLRGDYRSQATNHEAAPVPLSSGGFKP